jgi:hypothetical protein
MAEIKIQSLSDRIKKLEEKKDDEITVIVKDYKNRRYEIYVNPDDLVQTILDKYKLELIKNVNNIDSYLPVNENEYKYVLRISEDINDLYQTISSAGIANESTINIYIKKNNDINELRMKISQLEEQSKNFKIEISQLEEQCKRFEIENELSLTNHNFKLTHIIDNDKLFQIFLQILSEYSGDYSNDNIQKIIKNILVIFRQNSGITEIQFKTLIKLFITKNFYIYRRTGSMRSEKYFFDDPKFLTNYYTYVSPKSENSNEKIFEGIINKMTKLTNPFLPSKSPHSILDGKKSLRKKSGKKKSYKKYGKKKSLRKN